MSSKGPNKNTRGEKPSKNQSIAQVYSQIIQLASLSTDELPQALANFKQTNSKYLTKISHFKRLFAHLKSEIGFGQGDDLNPKVSLDILDQDITLCRFFLLQLWPDSIDNTSKDELILFISKGLNYWLNLTLGHLKGCTLPSSTYGASVERIRFNCEQLFHILPHYENMLHEWAKNPGRDAHKKKNKLEVVQLLFKPIKSKLILEKLMAEDSSETLQQLAHLKERLSSDHRIQQYLALNSNRYQKLLTSSESELKKYGANTCDALVIALARTLHSFEYFLGNEFTLHEGTLTPKDVPESFDTKKVAFPLTMMIQSIESTPPQIMDMPLKTFCISAPYLIARPDAFDVKTYFDALRALERYQGRYLIGKHPLLELMRERLNLLSANIKCVLEEKMGIQKSNPITQTKQSLERLPQKQEQAVQVLTVEIKPEDIPFEQRGFEQQLIDAPRSSDGQKRNAQCQYVLETHKKKLKKPKYMTQALEELTRYCTFIDTHVQKRPTQETKLRLLNEAINTLHFFIEDIVPCANGFETASAAMNAQLLHYLDQAVGLSCALNISPQKPKGLRPPKDDYEALLEGGANKYFVTLALISENKLYTDSQRLMNPSFFKSGIELIRAIQSMAVSCTHASEQLRLMQKAQAAHTFITRHLKSLESYDALETVEGNTLHRTFNQQKEDIEQQIIMLSQPKKSQGKSKATHKKPYSANLVQATPSLMHELMAEPMFFDEEEMAHITDAMAAMALQNPETRLISISDMTSQDSRALPLAQKKGSKEPKGSKGSKGSKESKESQDSHEEDTVEVESAELAQLRLEVAKLKDAVQKQEKNELATDMHVHTLEEENARLKKELAQKSQAHKKTTASLESLSQRHKNLLQSHEKTLETSRSRQSEIRSLKSQLQKKDERIDELVVDQQELEQMQAKALKRDQAAQAELSSREKQRIKLEEKLQRTKEHAEQVTLELKESQAQTQTAHQKFERLEDEHKALSQALVKTLKQNKVLVRQVEEGSPQAREITSDLQQQVLRLQQKLAQEQAMRLEAEQKHKEAQISEAKIREELENARQIVSLFSPKPLEKAKRLELLEAQEEAFKTKLKLQPTGPLAQKISKVQDLMSTLEGTEDRVYIDGGVIRCQLTGLEHSDIDLITTRSQTWVKENCEGFVQNSYMPWLFTNYSDPDCHIDLVTCPDLDLKQQAQLRDLSCNALFANKSLEIFDPLGCGLLDIQQKRLNVIGDSCERFKEDPKRIFRLVRFWCELGWPLSRETMFAAKIYSKNLTSLPYGVYIKNLSTLFDKPLHAFNALNQLDILAEMFGFGELDSAKHNPILMSFWHQELSKGPARSVIGLFLLNPYLMRQQMTSKDMAPVIIAQFFSQFKDDPYFNHVARFEKIKQNLVEDLYHYTQAFRTFCEQHEANQAQQKSQPPQSAQVIGESIGPSPRTFTPAHQNHKHRARSASPKMEHPKESSGKRSGQKKINQQFY